MLQKNKIGAPCGIFVSYNGYMKKLIYIIYSNMAAKQCFIEAKQAYQSRK